MPNDFNLLVNARYGKMIVNQYCRWIGESFVAYGEYSEGECELFRQIVQRGDTVYEIGANIGAHTLVLSDIVGDEGEVYAFEPQRLVFQVLCGNMALNNRTNVACERLACGSKADVVKLPAIVYTTANNNGGANCNDPANEGETCAVVTLDSLQIGKLDFLKIDTEGMEQDVIQGAAFTIKRCRPIIYCENDRGEPNSSALIAQIKSLEYRIWRHCPLLYNAANYYKNTNNIFNNIGSLNMLCIPEESPVEFKDNAGWEEIT